MKKFLIALFLICLAPAGLSCGGSGGGDGENGVPTTYVSYKVLAIDGQVEDRFGYSVAISGDYAIVGAPGKDQGGVDAGAAYLNAY